MKICIDLTRSRHAIWHVLLLVGITACSAPSPQRNHLSAPPASPDQRSATRVVQPAVEIQDRFDAALELMRARQYEQAREAFESLQRDHPTLSGSLTNLAMIQARTGDTAAAIQSLTAAIRANPHNAVAWNWIGTLYRESGQYSAAERAYREALSVRPRYAEAQFNLALLYDVAMKRPTEAAEAYRAYLRLTTEPELVVNAWIHGLESDLKSAPIRRPTHLAEAAP